MTQLSGNTGVSATMSTALNVTLPLAAGTYALWCSQNAYIMLPPSTALTAAIGYPIIGASAPKEISVPQNGQIGFLSTSSGTFAYMKV